MLLIRLLSSFLPTVQLFASPTAPNLCPLRSPTRLSVLSLHSVWFAVSVLTFLDLHLSGKPVFHNYCFPMSDSICPCSHLLWLAGSVGPSQQAGVNPSFDAHSVRGAAVSMAFSLGASLSDILRSVDWSQESTFRTFYSRPIPHAAHNLLKR